MAKGRQDHRSVSERAGDGANFDAIAARKRHWTARIARTLMKFWLDHWQWTIGAAIAICGLAIALARQ
jgi:hypothetical protein